MSQSIAIHVTPYIKKFVDARFGAPVVLHGRSTALILLRALLFKTSQLSLFQDDPKTGRRMPCTVFINPPSGGKFEPAADTGRIRIVSQFFDTLFLEEMKAFMDKQLTFYNRRRGDHNIKVQLARFCEQYGIQVEEDITEDALVKMYYRYRKWLSAAEPSDSPVMA